jgi:hypothetical protein
MESIKESICKTKSVLADWNIINKNENNIKLEIDDTSCTSNDILINSSSKMSIDINKLNTIDKLNGYIKYYETNEEKPIETNEILKKSQMIDAMFLKLEKIESKIENLEKLVKNNETNLHQLSNNSVDSVDSVDSIDSVDSVDSLNGSKQNINRNCINYTYPEGLTYLSYGPSFINSYNRNLLFNQYMLSPATLEILKKIPNNDSFDSNKKLSQIEDSQIEDSQIEDPQIETGWTFLGIKIL